MTIFRLALVLIGCQYFGSVLSGAEPAPPGEVRQVKVIADKAPDCSSLKAIVDSVTRDAILFADAGLAPARLSDTELKAELLRALTLYLRLEED